MSNTKNRVAGMKLHNATKKKKHDKLY